MGSRIRNWTSDVEDRVEDKRIRHGAPEVSAESATWRKLIIVIHRVVFMAEHKSSRREAEVRRNLVIPFASATNSFSGNIQLELLCES